MKTADLIPFILLELKENDKYGFELTKSIETKSNGLIVIKQPTLYTILKKLEKSKFISSYWEDSEIGGKRHYYKITENGLKQTNTLPSYAELLKSVCENSADDQEEKVDLDVKENIVVQPNNFSIFDHLTPQETVLPSEEVFAENTIDSATEVEINQQNVELLKEEKAAEEKFANNIEVSKFTKTISTETPKEIFAEELANSSFDTSTLSTYKPNFDEVKYVDYVDYKKDENYVYAKKTSKALTTRILLSCSYLLIMLVISTIIAAFTYAGPIYYTAEILAVIILIFVPTIHTSKFKLKKEKLRKEKLNINFKKYFILTLIIEIIILLSCTVLNIILGNNSLICIFNFMNFPNIYAPLLFGSSLIFDSIICKILLKNK